MTEKNLKNQKNECEETNYSKLKELFILEYGLELIDNKHKQFKFEVYLSDGLNNVSIDTLDLSPRSSNCLRRAGINTVYDLYTSVRTKDDLKKIRNCGAKSACEIMEQIFLFQYNNLSEERQTKFIKKILEINCN